MMRFIVHRLLQGIVLLALVATIVFFLGRLTGNPVDLKLTAYIPDAKSSPSILVHLEGNEFRQLGRILASIGSDLTTAYNGRISVEVTGGAGRVAAYGSVIDNASLDPTYVPAQ